MSDQKDLEHIQSTFIQLEHEARHAETLDALSFIMCNSSKKLFPFHQAVLWRKTLTKRVRIETVSGTGLINREAPYLIWLRQVCSTIGRSKKSHNIHQVNPNALPKKLAEQWAEFSPPYVLWCPLMSPQGDLMGGLWFNRDTAFEEAEITIIQELIDAYSHAWHALTTEAKTDWIAKLKDYQTRRNVTIAGLLVAAILLFPVRQTVLGPGTIAAKDPNIISSPLEGVVAKVYVDPNQTVIEGQKLFALDNTKFLNQFKVAQKSMAVAEEKYRKAGQHAFESEESKADLAVLAAEVEKNKAQVVYARSVLDKITITAPQDGIVIFTNKHEWIGKPVVVGEKVMTVADPKEKELDVWLPVSDAIHLRPGGKVKIFLNVAPLSPIVGNIKYVSYSATERPDGTLAYSVRATFPEDEDVPRIGLKGTAKLYGDRVVLIYYLLWRPVSAMRRFVGV